jgi:hypothetical protein
LKSKTIGAPSFGAGGGLALKANLRDIGIMSDQYTALSIGAGPAAFAALVNKQVDALVTWDAMLGAAENTGLALRTVNIPLQDSLWRHDHRDDGKLCEIQSQGARGHLPCLHQRITFRPHQPRGRHPGVLARVSDDASGQSRHRHRAQEPGAYSRSFPREGDDGKTGVFNPAAGQNSQATYQGTGALKGSISAESGYTTRFVDACNAFDREAVAADAKKY